MTIIADSRDIYIQKRKGLHYGKTSVHDQIANRPGQTSPGHSSKSTTSLLESAFPTRFHTGSTVRNFSPSTIFPDRLSWHHQASRRFLGHPKPAGAKQDTALHNPAKSSVETAKKNVFEGLLGKIFEQAKQSGLIKASSSHTCSIDSTGLENHYVSRHFIMRQNGRTRRYRRWTKLLIVCDNDTHLIASALVSAGPGTDCHYLESAVGGALRNIPIKTLLADSGFDAEYNHRFCCDRFGIDSAVIQVNERNLKYGKIGGFFRKRMKAHFPKKKYHQRWQIEAVFSRFKRRLGHALRARSQQSRTSECLLRVLTYNLMILYLLFKKSFLSIFSTEQT